MDRLPRRFQLDLAAYRLLRDGRPVRLERQPMELLILLASRPGALVTRQEIAARFWADGVFVDVEGSINRIVGKLRLALHDHAAKPRFIETVVGKGYRLISVLDTPTRSTAVPQQRAAAVSDREVVTQPNSARPADDVAEAEFPPRARGLALDLVTPKSLIGKRSI